jgi:hypothetical protein
VNLVSRVVGAAAGGEVVIDTPMADELATDTRLSVVYLGEQELGSCEC